MPRAQLIRTNGIRFHRLRLEMTQAQLAEAIGVTLKFVSFWETGRAVPSPERLARLAEVLESHPDLLLKPIDKRNEKRVDVYKMLRLAERRPPRTGWEKITADTLEKAGGF